MSAHDHAQSHDHDHSHESHGSVKLYVSVAVALLILTFCSYLTDTPLWPFGESTAIKRMWMMAVSCTKAMLVIMFFMHLKWEANWKWVLTIPASLMSIFLVFMLVPDVGMRMRRASNERLKYSAEMDEDDYSKEALEAYPSLREKKESDDHDHDHDDHDHDATH
ncbi:MAG: cytochrome C oxidase subunit IV family protein [Planctomycetales bacterium]|nr:cytochrome C oxidase subunit IV family protein [Planctomycetales bacterium]